MGARQFSSRLLKIVKTVVLLGKGFPVVHVIFVRTTDEHKTWYTCTGLCTPVQSFLSVHTLTRMHLGYPDLQYSLGPANVQN